MSLWNVAGVLQKPNDITFLLNSPFLVQKVAALWALEVNSICQHPERKVECAEKTGSGKGIPSVLNSGKGINVLNAVLV